MSIKAIIISICAAIIAIVSFGYFSYNKGYDAGVNKITAEVSIQKKQWEDTVNLMQNQHNKEIARVETEHKIKNQQYEEQIAYLKKHPKIIEKYVPQKIEIPFNAVTFHDRSALGVSLDKMLPDSNLNNKQYQINDLLGTIGYNYNLCNLCYSRLEALQKIVKQYQEKQASLLKQNAN